MGFITRLHQWASLLLPPPHSLPPSSPVNDVDDSGTRLDVGPGHEGGLLIGADGNCDAIHEIQAESGISCSSGQVDTSNLTV